MSQLPKSFWIRSLSIGIALTVPTVVVAATVTFAPNEVLDVAKLTALSNRTLDKDRVYARTETSAAIADGAAGRAIVSCGDESDIMLNCSCTGGSGSVQQVLHTFQVTGNDDPAALSTCTCNAVSSGATATRATALCIGLP